MNWLDLLVILCVTIGFIKGLSNGFVKQAISFLALIIATFFAGKMSIIIKSFISSYFMENSFSFHILNVISYILAFMLIIVAIIFLGNSISLVIKMTPIKPLDIMLGAIVGIFVWTFSLSILFNLFAVFDYNSRIISKQTQNKSVFYNQIKEIVPVVYPLFKNYFAI